MTFCWRGKVKKQRSGLMNPSTLSATVNNKHIREASGSLARPDPPSAAVGPNEKHQSTRALVFWSCNNLKSPFVVLGPPLSFVANKVRLCVENNHDPVVYNVNVNANPGARVHSVKYRFWWRLSVHERERHSSQGARRSSTVLHCISATAIEKRVLSHSDALHLYKRTCSKYWVYPQARSSDSEQLHLRWLMVV
jgi:hypothetical protein